MLFRRTEKAVADWPKMTILKRQGGVRLYGKYAGPALDGIGRVVIFVAVAAAMYYALQETRTWQAPVAVAGGMLVAWLFLGRSIMISTFGRTLDVRILPDVIRVKGKRYDRDAVRGFRMERHHKATQEARRERQRRKRSESTYREALEVVMDYGEKRIPIAAMPDRDERKAEALMYRLQDVTENLEMIVSGEEPELRDARPSDAFGKTPDIR